MTLYGPSGLDAYASIAKLVKEEIKTVHKKEVPLAGIDEIVKLAVNLLPTMFNAQENTAIKAIIGAVVSSIMPSVEMTFMAMNVRLKRLESAQLEIPIPDAIDPDALGKIIDITEVLNTRLTKVESNVLAWSESLAAKADKVKTKSWSCTNCDLVLDVKFKMGPTSGGSYPQHEQRCPSCGAFVSWNINVSD